MLRHDGRKPDELRPLRIRRHFTRRPEGSVLMQCGRTTVLCTASVEEGVPEWLAGRGRGWITAEYAMLPGSTSPRKQRERGRVDGRSTEIQRLVGRSMRAVADLEALGERTIWVDCDVLEADGGTRTAAITGAWIALADAVGSLKPARRVLRDSVAAVSVGIVEGRPLLDLDYAEDSKAEVDMNVVMTGDGRLVEVQGTGEAEPFTFQHLELLLQTARQGIEAVRRHQEKALGRHWPLD